MFGVAYQVDSIVQISFNVFPVNLKIMVLGNNARRWCLTVEAGATGSWAVTPADEPVSLSSGLLSHPRSWDWES